jgi:hypothetical protein
MKWVLVAAVLVLAMAGLWLVPQNRNDRESRDGGGVVAGSTASTPQHDMATTPDPVGTSGTHAGAAEDHGGEVITEIETITGATDAMELIGRRVDLHVDVQKRANDGAFWVGSPDNRLLVVLGRDTRDSAQRQRGVSSGHHAVPVRDGQRATVSGVIRPVPVAEQRYSWNLTADDERELGDRKVYIRAETVMSEGHGTE